MEQRQRVVPAWGGVLAVVLSSGTRAGFMVCGNFDKMRAPIIKGLFLCVVPTMNAFMQTRGGGGGIQHVCQPSDAGSKRPMGREKRV